MIILFSSVVRSRYILVIKDTYFVKHDISQWGVNFCDMQGNKTYHYEYLLQSQHETSGLEVNKFFSEHKVKSQATD